MPRTSSIATVTLPVSQARGRRPGGKLRSRRVDLIVLVTCFGSLATVALPRHLDFSKQARRGDTAALVRSIDGASRLANNLWSSAGEPDELITERGPVAMHNGFPAVDSLAFLLEPAETIAFEYRAGWWHHADTPAGGACGVYYSPPIIAGGPPVIDVDDSGC